MVGRAGEINEVCAVTQMPPTQSYTQMSARQNDNELISQVLGGNTQAYAVLVERYQNYVFTLCLRMVKSREDAEELAQDVFVKAFRYLPDFRGEAKFTTWMYTIVNNTCITFLRKKKQAIVSLDDESVFATADNMDSGSRANGVEKKSKSAMVNEAINMLSPDDAAIITLFYKHEQSLEEIAGILKLEANAAKVRLHRARTRLKEKMETRFPAEIKDLS